MTPIDACPLCDEQRTKELFSASSFDDPNERFKLLECTQCGLVRTFPGWRQLELERYYAAGYYGGEKKFIAPIEWLTRLTNSGRIRAIETLLSEMPSTKRPPRILDIGCGRAYLLRQLNQKGWECHGTERADFQVDLPNGIQLHQNGLEEIEMDGHFDVITIWHVLEHLPEPKLALQEVRRLLRPGGVVAVAVPNFASWQARLLAGYWPHLDLPRHLYHFTPTTLELALGQAKLRVTSRERGSFDQDLFGFIQGTLNKLGLPPNGLFRQMRGSKDGASVFALPFCGALATLLLTPAIIESLLARATRNSATLIVYATDQDQPSTP